MSDAIVNMTPKERVFGTLRNLLKIVSSGNDLNAMKPALVESIEKTLTWESEVIDI